MDLQFQSSKSEKKISIMTCDGVPFYVDVDVVMEMETLRSFMEDDDSQEPSTIPLPNVSSDTFAQIIDYIKTHMEFKEKANKCDDMNEKIDVYECEKYGKFTEEAKEYDSKYLENLDNDAIKEVLLAANYLNVKYLLDFLNKGIANRIKNKSVEYARKFFGIENDYTPEEERALRLEYPWAWKDTDED